MDSRATPTVRPLHLCDITMLYAAHSGGVRRYIEAKHEWLSRHTGVRHTVIAPGGRESALAPYHRVLPALPLPGSGGFRFPLCTGPWCALLAALLPDVIEAGDPYRLGWAALEAGQQLGVPTAGFYHSDLPSLVGARLGHAAARAAERYVARLYSRFDLVLAPSRAVQSKLQALGVPRVRVQPLGVDAQRFHPLRRSRRLRRELALAPGARLLAFAGRNAREKHLDHLLEAFRRLGPRYHLLLVGPRMQAPAQGNASVVSRYVGSLELASLLASCDALVHAGDAETFGLIVLEAMASGIPAVGVDAGAVPELITPATGTLARSSAPAHLAEAIEALFAQDVRAMGRAARQSVEAKWTWDRCFRGLLAGYEALLGCRDVGAIEGLARAVG
ncbi:MAG TPA: glycosyltransferase [Rhodocyclaceae bacterium]